MIHDFQYGQTGQQSTESRQGLVQVAAPTSRNSSGLPTTAQLTRIFSAAICSLLIALFFLILSQSEAVNAIMVTQPLLTLAGQVVLAGAMLALGVVLCAGIPLAVVAWRVTPRIRFMLAIPFLAVLLPMLNLIFLGFMHGAHLWIGGLLANIALAVVVWRATPPPRISFRFLMPFLAIASLLLLGPHLYWIMNLLSPLFDPGPLGRILGQVLSFPIPIIGNLGNLLGYVFLYGTPIISTIAINRAIRQAAIPDKWLRFARIPSFLVVFGLILMFLGVFFWGLYLAILAPMVFFTLLSPLTDPWNSWLLLLVGMLISVIIAARGLSSQW